MGTFAARSIALDVASPPSGEAADRTIHLDASANAPTTPGVRAAVMAALETGANPSSVHAAGDQARRLLVKSRDAVATLCEGLFAEDVIFTSGCTEANNLVVASAREAATFITTAVEHPSLLRPAEALAAQGGTVVVLPVSQSGIVDIEALRAALAAAIGPVVLSVQTANSESGVLQPIAEIAALAAERGDVLFHSDAAQAFGKFRLTLESGRGPDVISVSSHKLHGPMGVGALLTREGEDRLRPLLLGGDQERGLRAGTEALPLIAGFGAACAERAGQLAADAARMAHLRDQLEAGICARLPGVSINGISSPRLPNISNIRFPALDAMALVARLDAEGVLASQGSACHSRRPEPSHVLTAMGLSEDEAFEAVRFSVSPLNTDQDIDEAIVIIVDSCRRQGAGA
jgi:cysteine desulfurase